MNFIKKAIGTTNDCDHIKIQNGVAIAFNGNFSMGEPVNCGFDCNPVAKKFVDCFSLCDKTITYAYENDNLKMASGKFKASIPCLLHKLPHPTPSGDLLTITPEQANEFKKALCLTLPFLAKDVQSSSGRAFLTSAYTLGKRIIATNGHGLIEKWLDFEMPEVKINYQNILVLNSIKETCIGIQIADKSITFHFDDKKWIMFNQSNVDYNVNSLDRLINSQDWSKCVKSIDEDFNNAVSNLVKFSDQYARVYINNGLIYISENEKDNVQYQIQDTEIDAVYNVIYLNDVFKIAENYCIEPDISMFTNKTCRILLSGMRR